ncbi:MAG: ATP-binding protein [Pseudomonadales bacterium]
MLRSRFLWQLVASFGAVILASTLVFGFITATQVQRDTREHIEESLRTQAVLLRALFASHLKRSDPISSGELGRLMQDMDYRVTIMDQAGVVLADNRKAPGLMDIYADRPEILMAQSHQAGVSERYSETVDQNMLYVALSVEEKDNLSGYVRVGVPLVKVDEQLTTLRNRILISAFLIAGLCLLLVFYLARRFTKPLSEMTNVATRLAQGEHHLRLSVDQDDEIGWLSSALNELASGTEDRVEALMASRNQLAAILSGLTEGVIAVDLKLRIVHMNDAALHMLGIDNNDVIGAPLWEVVRVSEINQAAETCLRELTADNRTLVMNGTSLDVFATPLAGEEVSEATGVIVVLQDVTEMLHLEKVRSDFVANASHELKTPISAIRGLVETILDDPRMSAEVLNQFAGRISNQAKKLDNIVRDLIHLSRFDTYARKMSVSRVDLYDLVSQLYASKKDDAQTKNVRFHLELPDDNVLVEGDQQALSQMVVNLVDNAIKYTAENGYVILRLKTRGHAAIVEVEDNGMGIVPEEQQRIFERFYRIDRARSREMGGTGLGLSIVKHIAQSHHGSVHVDSQPGRGSLFSVRLPLMDPD